MEMDPKNLYVSDCSVYQFSRKIKSPGTGPHVKSNIKIVVKQEHAYSFTLDTNNSYIEAICSA